MIFYIDINGNQDLFITDIPWKVYNIQLFVQQPHKVTNTDVKINADMPNAVIVLAQKSVKQFSFGQNMWETFSI